ncbi:signal recognition particle subunit srp68 [Stygiomarasmius scandens]|uniref:Signal recognition particle subunit SRP68 n=1 Tax=Marasmiellus scandens TaxID=2682957 RepID=A0ABR1JWU0_9AGAR
MSQRVQFRALLTANEQRSAYGLRYHDFARYRKHCANRTHRLRSSLKMTHGKGRDFKKLPALNPEIVQDGHLQLLLFESERAWAYSQELSTLSLQPSNYENASSLRHHATGRFRRSIHWAAQLLSHCQSLYASSRLSAGNLLEATIYVLILNGRFLRYRDGFEDALTQLSVARNLLDELANLAPTSRDQALATLFSDEIGPEIRYCAHELGHQKAYDVDGIVAEIAVKNRNEFVENCSAILAKYREEVAGGPEGTTRTLEPLMWEGERVPVRNPELVDVLLKVQQAEKKLNASSEAKSGKGSKKGVAAYDAILAALNDAEEVARKLSEAQSAGSASNNNTPGGSRDIHFVHTYIVYQLLSRRIQRDLLLVSALLSQAQVVGSSPKTKTTPAVDSRLFPAVVKLLDANLQSLNQMRTLSIVDDNPDLASAVDARISFTKAQRNLDLARCYVPTKKFAEAVALLQHANIHIRETTTFLSLSESDVITSSPPNSGTVPFYTLSLDAVKTLENDINEAGLQFKRDWFAYNGGTATEGIERKGHKKPLFFNIALNYVELDMDRLQERAGKAPIELATAPVPTAVEKAVTMKKSAAIEEEVQSAMPEPQSAPAKGGLSSLLGGWWGRN